MLHRLAPQYTRKIALVRLKQGCLASGLSVLFDNYRDPSFRVLHSYPEPWEDSKNGSTLGLYNPHHRSIRVKSWGFYFLMLVWVAGSLLPEGALHVIYKQRHA